METIKVWHREWFYITELPAEGQRGIRAFTTEPMRSLVSWMRRYLDRGNPSKVETLPKRLKSQIGHDIKLVDVIDVVLQRPNLPLQLRASTMWMYNTEDTIRCISFSAPIWTTCGQCYLSCPKTCLLPPEHCVGFPLKRKG